MPGAMTGTLSTRRLPAVAADEVVSPSGASSRPWLSGKVRSRRSSRAITSGWLVTVRSPLTCTVMIWASAW